MKALLFILLLSLAAIGTKANDTLTRAQVYNYYVGDTFDYRHINIYFAGSYTDTTVNFTRYVVTNISYSTDSSTKYIVSQEVFPATSQSTLQLNDIQGQEVVLDTILYSYVGGANMYIVTPLPDFFGRQTNYTTHPYSAPGQEELLFAEGLGEVMDVKHYGYHTPSVIDTTILIYYANDSVKIGTPYSDFLTAIQPLDAAAADAVLLYPTLNEGTFNVQITDAGLLPVNLTLYDITGREVKQLHVNDLHNRISIDNYSSGIYIWKAQSPGKLVQTGKMVLK